MKISRVRHVIITSIFFLVVIAAIVVFYNSQLNAIASNTEELKNRVIATEDILPGTPITDKNTDLVQIQDVIKVDNVVYRLNRNSEERESVTATNQYFEQVKAGGIVRSASSDDRWAIGKVAATKIYKGEMLVTSDLRLPEDVTDPNERVYSIPFNSATTGGYNVKVGDAVDICVLYAENSKNIKEYQNLDTNKVIDIILAKKEIVDIRDESGNSQISNSGVVPGYICFKLTYDEINKVELAKRQGTIFAGIPEAYIGEPQVETFMNAVVLPNF